MFKEVPARTDSMACSKRRLHCLVSGMSDLTLGGRGVWRLGMSMPRRGGAGGCFIRIYVCMCISNCATRHTRHRARVQYNVTMKSSVFLVGWNVAIVVKYGSAYGVRFVVSRSLSTEPLSRERHDLFRSLEQHGTIL